jgi:hypothetical protein
VTIKVVTVDLDIENGYPVVAGSSSYVVETMTAAHQLAAELWGMRTVSGDILIVDEDAVYHTDDDKPDHIRQIEARQNAGERVWFTEL